MPKGSIVIAFLTLIGGLFALPGLLQHIKIWRWQKALRLNHFLPIFSQIFAEIDGFKLSKEARASNDAMEYVYGEIEFTSFIALLSLTHPNQHTVFYDLGSGTGKAVIACALVFDVKKSCGIELFEPLQRAATECQQRFKRLLPQKAEVIQFFNEDFLTADFHEATLIFINASAFFGESWERLNERLEMLTTPDLTIITTTKKLLSANFIPTRVTTVKMSWGVVQAYIQKRKINIQLPTAN